jgi:acetyl-CoA acyltransferase
MTRVPIPGFNPLLHPAMAERFPQAYMSMGETAENVADKYKIPRERQEELAVLSHQKAAKAQAEGRFGGELVAITQGNHKVEVDGCIRPDTNAAALADLKPAFKDSGSVTAATSSPLTDGAAATLVTSEDFAKAHGLTPLARIKAIAVGGCAPEIMGMGPVVASGKAMERAGVTAKDLDVVELNEAFASQALACIDELGLEMEKINIDGGALALGHPLGATGARITGKAAQVMNREGKGLARRRPGHRDRPGGGLSHGAREDREGRRHRRRRDGRWHRRPGRQRRDPGGPTGHRPEGRR